MLQVFSMIIQKKYFTFDDFLDSWSSLIIPVTHVQEVNVLLILKTAQQKYLYIVFVYSMVLLHVK